MQQLQQQESLGFLIAAARRRIKQAVWSRVAELKLTPQQFWMLVGMYRRGETSLNEIATRTRMDNPTASRVVAGLVVRGLVETSVDPEDRRRSRLLLSRAGRKLAQERLLPIQAEIRSGVELGLSPAEIETARDLLGRIVANAERLTPPPEGE